jgi:hypothetical protein
MVIRRVAPVSCAKIAAVLYAVGGLLVGGLFSLVALAGGFATSAFAADPSRRGLGSFFGFGALSIVLFPILYGALGFVGALIGAWLYNAAAGIVGGIRIDVE